MGTSGVMAGATNQIFGMKKGAQAGAFAVSKEECFR
jgi:hypothetical protein